MVLGLPIGWPSMTVFAMTFTGACAVLLVRAEATGSPDVRLFKMAASTGFIAIALSVGGLSNTYGRIVLVALLFSWAGDLLLTFTTRPAFLAGLVTFLLAQVAYSTAFGVLGVDATIAAAAVITMTIIGFLIWRWLGPHVSDMAGPVLAYVVVITVMVVMAFAAFGAGATVFIPIGAVVFYASDIAVAKNQFVAPGIVNRMWGLPLYYLAQVLLASTAGG
jgi:uncharacterized membrane protein YhhN